MKMKYNLAYVLVFFIAFSCITSESQPKILLNEELNLSIMEYNTIIDNKIKLKLCKRKNLDTKENFDYLKQLKKGKDDFIYSFGSDCSIEKKKLDKLIFLISGDPYNSVLIKDFDVDKYCFDSQDGKSNIVKRHIVLRDLEQYIGFYIENSPLSIVCD